MNFPRAALRAISTHWVGLTLDFMNMKLSGRFTCLGSFFGPTKITSNFKLDTIELKTTSQFLGLWAVAIIETTISSELMILTPPNEFNTIKLFICFPHR